MTEIFTLASFLGSIAFALSGFLAGVRKQLDLMGIFIVTMLTANGGGALRDVLVGQTPKVLLDASAFILVCMVLGCAMLLRLHRFANLERHWLFVVSDAVGLVAFSLTGTLVGIAAGLPIF